MHLQINWTSLADPSWNSAISIPRRRLLVGECRLLRILRRLSVLLGRLLGWLWCVLRSLLRLLLLRRRAPWILHGSRVPLRLGRLPLLEVRLRRWHPVRHLIWRWRRSARISLRCPRHRHNRLLVRVGRLLLLRRSRWRCPVRRLRVPVLGWDRLLLRLVRLIGGTHAVWGSCLSRDVIPVVNVQQVGFFRHRIGPRLSVLLFGRAFVPRSTAVPIVGGPFRVFALVVCKKIVSVGKEVKR